MKNAAELSLSATLRPEKAKQSLNGKFRSARRRRMAGQALWHAIMLLFAAAWLIPLLWMLRNAFLPKDASIGAGWSWNFTLDNFSRVWQGAPFGQYMWNTLLVTSGIFAVQIVTLTLAAYAFARVAFVGRHIVFMLFLVQIMVPSDVLIFSNYQIINELGLLDTKIGIMLPYFASAFGVFLLRQAFKQLPYELDEAARVEGCSSLGILLRIYMPLSKPVYLSFAIVSISFHWNDFLWPLIVTNSPENRLLTVGLAMFAKSTEAGAQWTDVSAATLIVTAPMLIGFMLFQRQFISSFMHSGIKG
ncbi:sn-glycerol 3-phosphate transport system permease protein [Paenibacillus pabuli]|uniref:Carbohydrate ABC transporter membrane protein 2 (CUT1 family) n=2 Tax=Paenibacillus TaxID=44249 RepID=A0A855XQQ1_9BACL|nr:carbohydrate ABC transporter membrane protein 2 (CUT1 family) [Paenibacillus pabuli]PXW01562.1 sn-glycerol 3-phosphate transport system permease protein [Paenibacillus taichungensis]RAI88566.1 sn-glycerol 3-phosphate transport system permease protein [Paenibacillus pabuli]